MRDSFKSASRLASIPFALWVGAAHADEFTELGGVSDINYNQSSRFALGDTVSIDDLSAPRDRCVQYDKQLDVVQDTEGSIGSKLHVYLVKNYDDLENQFDVSFNLQASGGAKFGSLFGGSAELTQFGKFENFVKHERNSAMLVVELSADQGRDYIRDYRLNDEAKALKDTDLTGFIKKCGTHFVRAVTRRSAVRVIFNVSNINDASKTIIDYKFHQKGEVKADLAGLAAQAKSDIAVNLSNTLSIASKLGKVSVDIDAVGGAGVPTLGKVIGSMNVGDPNDLNNLLNAIMQVSADFTRKNSAPDKFILVPFTGLSPTLVNFDSSRFDKLGKMYKALLRVDQQLSIYQAYKDQYVGLWTKYFRQDDVKLSELRKALVGEYEGCKAGGSCGDPIPDKVGGLILDDVVYDQRTRASCPLSFTTSRSINAINEVKTRFLSTIIISWQGGIRYHDDIDLLGTQLFRISLSGGMERLPFDPRRQLRTEDTETKERFAYITLYRAGLDEAKAVVGGQVDLNYLSALRDSVAESIFVIRFHTYSGIPIDETVGYANLKGCKIMDDNL